MTYNAIKDVCERQLSEWLELAKQNPELRDNQVWYERIATLQKTAQFPELESRYLRHLEGLTDTQQRRGLAIIGLALTAYQQAGERAMWGFCLRAACEVLQLPHHKVVAWWNAQHRVAVEDTPEMPPLPDVQPQQQTRLLN